MANPIPPGFFVFALRFVGIDIDTSGKCTLSLGCPRTAQDVLET
jgi:hypothetical protein